jgi:signal transduction histidine kinase/GGDEF domain-containing protein
MNDRDLPARILVADDDALTRRIMSDLLLEMGHEVIEAFDGPSALERATLVVPDLILADIVMPRLDGVELLRALRADPRLAGVPVLLVTSVLPRPVLQSCLEAGADDVLSKDRLDAELPARVRTLLRAARLGRQLTREREWLDSALQVAKATSGSLDVNDVLAAAVRAVGDRLGAVRCSVLLVDEANAPGQAVVVADRDSSANSGLAIDLRKYPELGAALDRRDLVVIDDAAASDILPPEAKRSLAAQGVRALVVAPLVTRGTGLGAIFLRISRTQPFSEQDLDFCRVVAAATANAVHGSWLYQRAIRERQELERAHAERERALLGANATLLRAIEEKDETLALCAHDLRTPLSVMRGQARRLQGLLEGGEAGAQAEGMRKAAQSIERQAIRCSDIIDDLLLRRVGNLEVQPARIDLVDVVRRASEALAGAADRAGVEVTVEAPAALPWKGDGALLERAVGNLLDNALRHAPLGSKVMVRLARLADEGPAKIEVLDTGGGIAAAELPHLFEPMHQQGAPTRRGGLGFGLSIAREIAQRHGGTLTAENRGRGACFSITLSPREEDLLPGERFFLEKLDESLQRSATLGEPVSIAVLRDFALARVPAGEATRQVAQLVEAARPELPPGGISARLSADRVALLLPRVDEAGAHTLVRRIAARFRRIAVGVATATRAALPSGPTTLLAEAEACLGDARPRLLVVEDEPEIGAVLDAFFSAEGRFEVILARTGADALEKARAQPPDLALLDLELPDMDGARVLERLRQELKDLPALAWSCRPPEEAGSGGFAALLRKPLDMKALAVEVDKMLGRRPA